jgi:hypothetical protein
LTCGEIDRESEGGYGVRKKREEEQKKGKDPRLRGRNGTWRERETNSKIAVIT